MLKNGNCLHFRHSLIGACLSSTNLIESIFLLKSEFKQEIRRTFFSFFKSSFLSTSAATARQSW